MKIPIINLKRQYQAFKPYIDDAIREVVDSQNFILGPWVKKLEEKVASYIGVSYGIGVASGTDALLLSLKSAGVRPGDEVITTPFTFVATASTIALAGATPVFVDINPKTFNMDPDKVREAITERTKGLAVVHLYGLSADMAELLDIADSHGLFIIEDGAQAFGGTYKGNKLGSFGLSGAFSFFPSKNLGGFGDGGMVVTSREDIAEKVRMLRQHGGKDKYNAELLGHNSRLDSLQASVLLAKLEYVDQWNRNRRTIASLYNEGLKGINNLSIPYEPPEAHHVYYQYTLRTPKRNALKKFLEERGIETRIYYPYPLHRQELFKSLGRVYGSLEEVEKASNEILSLPMDPLQTEEETKKVIQSIKECRTTLMITNS